MFSLDRWIINHMLEPVSKWTQRTFGLDCFSWAVFFFVISGALFSFICCNALANLIMGILLGGSHIIIAMSIVSICYSIYLLWIYLYCLSNTKFNISRIRKLAYEWLESGLKNPLLKLFRVSFVVLLGVITHVLVRWEQKDGLMTVFAVITPPFTYWLAVALCACTPDRQQTSWIKKRWEGMKAKHASANPAENLVPVPV